MPDESKAPVAPETSVLPNERERIIGEKKESCVPFFDALWFCYSTSLLALNTFNATRPQHSHSHTSWLHTGPIHQMKEYYTYGTVDDCNGHWGKLMDCLKRKTTRYKDDAPIDPGSGKHPLWQLRTGIEAKEFWRKEFSSHHSSNNNSSDGSDGDHRQPPTMV